LRPGFPERCLPAGYGGIVCGAVSTHSIENSFNDIRRVVLLWLHASREFCMKLAAIPAGKAPEPVCIPGSLTVPKKADLGVSHIQVATADRAERNFFTPNEKGSIQRCKSACSVLRLPYSWALHYEIASLQEGYRFVVLLLSPQYQLLYWYYIYPFVA